MNKTGGLTINVILAIVIFLVGIFFGKILMCKYLGVMC